MAFKVAFSPRSKNVFVELLQTARGRWEEQAIPIFQDCCLPEKQFSLTL